MTDGDLLDALRRGPRLSFADGSVAEKPSAPGVYAVWEGPALLYVGMSGRLPSRLRAHASGRQSGGQFCVYVADRLVLPERTAAEVAAVGAGELSLDALTRAYIRERLTVSVVATSSGEAARRVERIGRACGLDVGPPLLTRLPERSDCPLSHSAMTDTARPLRGAAARAGMHERAIMRATLHKSERTLRECIRDGQLLDENPTDSLGL